MLVFELYFFGKVLLEGRFWGSGQGLGYSLGPGGS